MPDAPDFEQIAREAARSMLAGGVVDFVGGVATFAEQLRLVWNARGAADLAKTEALELTTPLSLKMVDRALRSLDR